MRKKRKNLHDNKIITKLSNQLIFSFILIIG